MEKNTVQKAIVGVDVGGTNTDAVVIIHQQNNPKLISYGKQLTTPDVTSGVRDAIYHVLKEAHQKGYKNIGVTQVNIGTTHFVNAMVQGRNLTKVSVIRLCGSASTALPPFSDFPNDLKQTLRGSVHLCQGGFQFDGSIIANIQRGQIQKIIGEIKSLGIKNIVISGIFSPVRSGQEQEVEKIISQIYPQASVTLSYKLGNIGLLERQNAAILNQCIKPLCKKTIQGFKKALKDINIQSQLYLTQNDGSVLSADRVLDYPIYSFASGVTNSMRGAMFLCKQPNAIVLDIGGTTTDVGVLKNGFPREASTKVKLARVKTNFRMPDVVSIGLGGGSYVNFDQDKEDVKIGPLSAGYNLKNQAYIFKSQEEKDYQNRSLTASDVAVAAGFLELGSRKNVSHLQKDLITKSVNKIVEMVENCIDMVKLSDQKLPIILVGGGAVLVDPKRQIKGASQVFIPKQAGVANAIGAALSQVSVGVDSVVDLQSMLDKEQLEKQKQQFIKQNSEKIDSVNSKDVKETLEKIRTKHLLKIRSQALDEIIKKASLQLQSLGADPTTIQLRQKQDLTLAYMPGQATRIRIKMIGDLKWYERQCSIWQINKINPSVFIQQKQQIHYKKQTTSSMGKTISEANECVQSDHMKKPQKPFIDQKTDEWILSEWDVEAIAIGAGIFGCGGGGNTHLGRIRTLDDVKKGKKIRIITAQTLYQKKDPQHDKICPIAYFGAPLAIYQQLVTRNQMNNAIKCFNDIYTYGGYEKGDLIQKQGVQILTNQEGVKYIDNYQPKHEKLEGSKTENIVGILICQIGGLNALEPFVVAADMGVPIVDQDGMGRAFPQLGMFTPYTHGINPYPVAMTDHKGHRAVVLEAKTGKSVQDHLRSTVVKMGCEACIALGPLNKKQLQQTTIKYSVSRAWYLGDCILRARLQKTCPIRQILQTQTSLLLMKGKIKDVKRQTESGYNKGYLVIEGFEQFSNKLIKVHFQNEFIIVRNFDEKENKQHQTIATVPDLITIVDSDSAEPIQTEEIKYGMRICVIVIAAPQILKSERSLKHVGPASFGYKDEVYRTIGKMKDIQPIPPLPKVKN